MLITSFIFYSHTHHTRTEDLNKQGHGQNDWDDNYGLGVKRLGAKWYQGPKRLKVKNRGETTRGETTSGAGLGGETSCYPTAVWPLSVYNSQFQ